MVGDGGAVKRAVHRLVLHGFGVLPRGARRFLVRTLRPSWTAGVMAIVERSDGRWLMVRPVYRKGWALPGGLLDRGEHPERAIHRELREELGVMVVLEPDPWMVFDTVLRRLDVVFRARLAPGVEADAVQVTTAELDDVGWFDPDHAPLLEEETSDVLLLRRRVLEGGDALLVV